MCITFETLEALERLSKVGNEDKADVLLRGVALLMVAAKAKEEGKQIGIGREGEPMEKVIDVF